MALWIDTANGHYCSVHDQSFVRGDVCQACASAGPSETPETVVAIAGDLAKRIEMYRARARKLRCLADEIYEDDERDYHGYNAGAKLESEATKLDRLAEERQEILNNREHDLELIRHEREMSGLRRSN